MPLNAEEIYVRSMYIVSDRVNSYGGRFPAEEFPRLVDLLIDSPVLIGHRKDSLPIGRTFLAEAVNRDGKPWIKSRFYWLKSGAEAERLKENIDGGVCKECSIGFTFLKPECSVCGDDIRRCRHLPLETYVIGDREQQCHFAYRAIQQVLETSLVYRGATPDTSIVKELSIAKSVEVEKQPRQIHSLHQLEDYESYLLVPRYEGIDISFRMRDGVAVGWRSDERRVNLSMFGRLTVDNGHEDVIRRGRLVGLRGKERCSVANIERFLRSESGPVSRLVLYLYPEQNGAERISNSSSRHRVQPIRYRRVSRSELDATARMLMTKHGVEVICAGKQSGEIEAYLYFPEADHDKSHEEESGVSLVAGVDWAHLRITDEQVKREFAVRKFSLPLFARGRRFVADEVTGQSQNRSGDPAELLDGVETRVRSSGESLLIETGDPKIGTIVVSPVRLHGRRRNLLYRVPSSSLVAEEADHAS